MPQDTDECDCPDTVPGNKDRVRPPAYRRYNWGRRECEVRSFMSQIGDARTAFFQVTKTSAARGESISHRSVKAQASLCDMNSKLFNQRCHDLIARFLLDHPALDNEHRMRVTIYKSPDGKCKLAGENILFSEAKTQNTHISMFLVL